MQASLMQPELRRHSSGIYVVVLQITELTSRMCTVAIKYKLPYWALGECGYTRTKLRSNKFSAYVERRTLISPFTERKLGHDS
jgi:hypothetical protein